MMKPITWLRKFAKRGNQGYPVATLAFYGPDDKKASKAVLGIILSKDSKFNCTNGSESRPTPISVTTSSCRTPGLRLSAEKASEASR